MKGLEPSRPKAHAPKACVSTNSTTSACNLGLARYASLPLFTEFTQRVYALFAFHAANTFLVDYTAVILNLIQDLVLGIQLYVQCLERY